MYTKCVPYKLIFCNCVIVKRRKHLIDFLEMTNVEDAIKIFLAYKRCCKHLYSFKFKKPKVPQNKIFSRFQTNMN